VTAAPANPAVIVDDPSNRVDPAIGQALQTILFSSFALEYRLKRVLMSMNVPFPPKETLGPLLDKCLGRLSGVARLDDHGNCSAPAAGQVVEPILKRLVEARNDIAHANYKETLRFFSGGADPQDQARHFYNALIDGIRFINEGTGFDTRPKEELDKYFQPLKA
jgi:hypothetical protein